MAKGNLFLGKARGKIGDVILTQTSGRQIARAYQPQVKNPRSGGQMIQRASFATCSLAASIMSSIIDHSFDGVKEGQDNRQEFIKANINRMKALFNENGYDSLNTFILPKGAKYIKPFAYMVSRGNLGFYQPIDMDTWLPYGTDMGTPTLDTFKKAFPWIKNGSQLTQLIITYRQDLNGNVTYNFYKSRLVFNNQFESFDGYKSILPAGGVAQIGGVESAIGAITADILDLPKCENVVIGQDYIPTADDDEYTFTTARFPWSGPNRTATGVGFKDQYFGDNEYVVAWTMIGTQYDSSKADPWIHTTSFFAVNTDRWDDTNDNIATYGNVAKSAKQSDYYLDQAIPSTDIEPSYNLDELLTAEISAEGLSSKPLNMLTTNTYGPVAEGAPLTVRLFLPDNYKFRANTLKIFNGETEVTRDWTRSANTNRTMVALNGLMPTTASFAMNISVQVYDKYDELVGTVALRCTVRKSNV